MVMSDLIAKQDIVGGGKRHLSHFVLEVGNNGCGPESTEHFLEDLKKAHNKAKKTSDCISMSYAGLYDVLVYPSGVFSLIPTNLEKFEIPGVNENTV